MPETDCDLCRHRIDLYASYVVRIDVFADPTMPPINTGDLSAGELTATMDDLLREMAGMSVEALQDGVHRRFEYRLCGTCQKQFLGNPLGKPRAHRAGEN